MDYRVIVVLIHLGFGFTFSSPVLPRVYHYVNMKMNWADARTYCKDNYKDLATFESMEDIQKLKRPSMATAQAWIGLKDHPTSWKEHLGAQNSWRWSTGKAASLIGYSNWDVGRPVNFAEEQYCGRANFAGKWMDESCNLFHHFICFNDSSPPGNKTYTYYMTQFQWEEAQSFCRANHKDLALVENALEQSKMMVDAVRHAWIGLYRRPWIWSDRSWSLFRNWNNNQPNPGIRDGHCVYEMENHLWYNAACSEEFVFICYGDVAEVHQQTVRMKIRSDADLSDPAVSDYILQQLTAQLQRKGYPGIKLTWKKKPEKEKKQDLSTDNCNV